MNNGLLYKLFQLNTLQQPEKIAIATLEEQIDYATLNVYSNNLSKLILQSDVHNTSLIAIIMEKGWEQVVSVLGILKSGKAYLPIDPLEDKERINYLLEIAQINVILTQDKYLHELMHDKQRSVILVNKANLTNGYDISTSQINNQKESDLAYVIFTSGSTGAPKGVMVAHKAALNTIIDINNRFSVNNTDKILAISNLVFDLSVYDIFGILSAGGTIIIDKYAEIKSIFKLEQLFFNNQVTIWNSVPAVMEIFVDFLLTRFTIIPKHSLRLILLSGDWIPITLPTKIRNCFGNDVQIISLGGATEASIWSILYPVYSINPIWNSIPYGKPMTNQKFFILDKNLALARKGQSGELFIGGIGLALGYWNNIDLTKKHFIIHPKHGRLYKTGDLGRYLPDGNIEFLGRIDSQVKISGYRVELNAIQTYLLKFPAIKRAIVIPIKDKIHQKLAAYIVLKEKFKNFTEEMISTYVNDWKVLYNILYQNATSSKRYALLNTTGWVSSFNSKNIPMVQMLEWVNNTVAQILSLNPSSVLEIGCGTGMLLFKIAHQVDCYDAVDFSEASIEYIRNNVKSLNVNVDLYLLEAIKIKQINKKYHTIILNSIVQYFPEFTYFMHVLDQCINLVSENGYVYIGDIRSQCHLKDFYTAVLVNKKYDINNYVELCNSLDYFAGEEDELVIDHRFFYYLKSLNSKISHVEVLLKEGAFHNEMNCFRYNVILHINHNNNPKIDIKWTNWQTSKIDLEYIDKMLLKQVDYVAIKSIPNQRIYGIHKILNTQFNDKTSWQNMCSKIISQEQSKSIDPNVISQLAKIHNYQISHTWSGEPDKFDCIISKKHANIAFDANNYLDQRLNVQYANISMFFNNPILIKAKQYVIQDIKRFLKSQLPSYMVPQQFTVLEELPVTRNGKIDYKALPRINHSTKNYIIPKSITEKKVAHIWRKVLGVKKIGATQNFYEIGGSSLLTLQLIVKLNQEFKMNLELKDIGFGSVTIQNISKHIDRIQ